MMQAQHQPLTSTDEDAENVEMSQLGPDQRRSWLLVSESEDESSDEENGTSQRRAPTRQRLKRKRDSSPFLTSAIKHAWCCKLFFCCSRSTVKLLMLAFILMFSFVTFGISLRSNTCWSARDELFLLNRFDQSSANGRDGPWPLKSAHSHNDYLQTKPLSEALLAGFCSVEGDVFLLNGILYLGHAVASTETLSDTYLKPLAAIIVNNGGFVYRRSVRLGSCMQMTLLVDIKSAETIETWETLETLLEQMDKSMGDGRSLFETFDADNNVILPGDVVLPSPLRVVVTGVGNNAEKIATLMAGRKLHRTCLDLNYESTAAQTIKAARWISQKWSFTFPDPDPASWARTKKALLDRVKFAHTNGLLVRYWDTPENPDLWQALLDLQVDYINTDSIFTLHSFLTGKTVAGDSP